MYVVKITHYAGKITFITYCIVLLMYYYGYINKYPAF